MAWATTIAHHSDVGGIVPGSNALGADEIYQEGIRIPILKFMERGKPVDAVWDMVAAQCAAARPADGRPAGPDGGMHGRANAT